MKKSILLLLLSISVTFSNAQILSSINASPDTLIVGSSCIITITLDQPATSDVIITLSINPANAGLIPPSITISTGQQSTSFSYTPTDASHTAINITATLGATFANATIQVYVLATSSVSINNCLGSSITVPYSIEGVYNAGNVFTAQLSDVVGSFLFPVSIGKYAATTSGTINATIPPNTPAGTGYKIRVVSSNPIIKGTENGSNITINALPVVIANTSATTVCQGTSVTLTGSGTATAYTWSGGVTDKIGFVPSATTTYTVTGIDANSCSNTAAKTITVNSSLPDVTTNLHGLVITANQDGASYQWLNCNNANSPITGAITQSYTATTNGTYAVIVTQNACSDTSACVNTNTTGIDDTVNDNRFIFYPNPFTIQATITFLEEQKNTTVKITDVLGKEIKTITFSGKQLILDKGEMKEGIYFIQIIDINKILVNKKVFAHTQ